MKKIFKIFAFAFVLILISAIIGMFLFIKPVTEEVLRQYGLEYVSFETAHAGFDSITLKNVTINTTVPLKIAKLGITRHKEVLVRDLSATFGEGGIAGVNAVLQLSSLSPLEFGHQEIAVGALNAGLPLTDGKLDISMDRAGRITVHKSSWVLAGGTVATSPFSVSPTDLSADVTLTARKIDLVTMFRLVPMEGLDATGTANGTIPLKIRNGVVSIVNGTLQTTGGGSIRYSPKEVPAFLQGNSRKEIVDLRMALEAFDYDSLKLTLNGTAGQSQKISLQAKGKNPGFYDGRPVVINFNVEGPLQSVIQYAPGGSSIPDDIREQIETYEKKHGAK